MPPALFALKFGIGKHSIPDHQIRPFGKIGEGFELAAFIFVIAEIGKFFALMADAVAIAAAGVIEFNPVERKVISKGFLDLIGVPVIQVRQDLDDIHREIPA